MPHSFAALVAVARRHVDMTAAQFDHSLSVDDSRAMGAFGHAAYRLISEGLPVIDPSTPVEELRRREAAAAALLDEHEASIRAMVSEAKGKSYLGWSDASHGPIRYA